MPHDAPTGTSRPRPGEAGANPPRHARLRALLVTALREASPTDPTLCEGWEARHVAAHVWLRQQAPWAVHGSRLRALADEATDPQAYLALVDRVAEPAAAWSPHSWAGNLMNGTEFYVHAHDVHRGPAAAAGTPVPDLLPVDDDVARALWRDLSLVARGAYRRAAPAVVLVEPRLGRRSVSRARAGAPTVALSGPVGELVLHAFGRGWASRLEIDGPDGAVRALGAVRPGPSLSGR